jgi:hypothetical protein
MRGRREAGVVMKMILSLMKTPFKIPGAEVTAFTGVPDVLDLARFITYRIRSGLHDSRLGASGSAGYLVIRCFDLPTPLEHP